MLIKILSKGGQEGRIFQIGLPFLLWLVLWLLFKPGLGYAQPEIIPFYQVQAQQALQQFVSLVLKKDICTLLDHCLIPPLSNSKRSFFALSTPAQTKIRLDLDEILRRHIDRLRELILVFHRLSISPKTPLIYQISPDHASNNLVIAVEMEPFASPLAVTISPVLANKDLTLSFTITIECSEEKWRIINISKARFHPRRL